MLIMARDRDYRALLAALRGKTVFIWTCSTCARLCGGYGGPAAAARLAEELKGDGIEVLGTAATNASCLTEKVVHGLPATAADVILSLTCDVGAAVVRQVSGKAVLSPAVTFGRGYLDADRVPMLSVPAPDGSLTAVSAAEAAAERGLRFGPFV